MSQLSLHGAWIDLRLCLCDSYIRIAVSVRLLELSVGHKSTLNIAVSPFQLNFLSCTFLKLCNFA